MKIGLDFPQRYYPRSFLSLLLLAFALVAAPLVVAFYNTAVYVEQLAGQSQTAVSQAAQASRGSRLLVEQTTALERVVRQYLILDDEELLKDYARLRANFKANTSELSLQPLDEPQLQELNSTIDKEQGLYEQLLGKPKTAAEKKALVEGYLVLSELARDVLNTSNALTDCEVEFMRRTGERAQRILWLQLAATIPLGILLAVGVTLLIARPIRQLDQAIRRLGAFFSSRSRHTRCSRDWSSDVCSSDLVSLTPPVSCLAIGCPTYSVNPMSVSLRSSQNATAGFTIQTYPQTPLASYNVAVTGTSGSLSDRKSVV